MNYSIRQTRGDDTVEISGDTVEGTFRLFIAVQENTKEQHPPLTDAVLRQVMDCVDELSETLKGIGGAE